MAFSWAENHPEVYKICTLFGLNDLSYPKRFQYRSLAPFIQDGPQCGLVALAMYLGSPNSDVVASLCAQAQEKGYTNHGEMFSASNMANLAKCRVNNPDLVQLFRGELTSNVIKDELFSGSCILVPYDTEKDNSPGYKGGLKAHWAIISGIVESDGFYILARHGKQKNVAIWPLSTLSASNSQLETVGQYEKNQNLEFRLPEGGIGGPLGLKNQCVILKR